MARPGEAWLGQAWLGEARHGEAWHGKEIKQVSVAGTAGNCQSHTRTQFDSGRDHRVRVNEGEQPKHGPFRHGGFCCHTPQSTAHDAAPSFPVEATAARTPFGWVIA